MVATLLSRKEALEAKILEKTEELKKLCLQEADLTGILPPETPLDPGEPPPHIRRRIGTSFSFPQNLINNLSGNDDVVLNELELACKVQKNISEASLALANDLSQNKAVRKKHRLMYRQSERRAEELVTRLTLLKQGKPQQLKHSHIKKKPRPNTTTVDPCELLREFNGPNVTRYYTNNTQGAWPHKISTSFVNELRPFSSLNRPPRSNETSISSGSPMLSTGDLTTFNNTGLPDQFFMPSSLSQPNMQDLKVASQDVPKMLKRLEKGSGRRQWDTQSAGGTLLPNQTYPEIHQPNLNRTQSLGSVDGQRQVKEKEWYETSLDSAPSPPLRSSSRLPSSARLMYQLQEQQAREAVNRTLAIQQKSHPVLTRTHVMRASALDEVTNSLHGLRMNTPPPRAEKPPPLPEHRNKDAVYIDIPEDVVDTPTAWLPAPIDGTKTPTQAFYHSSPSWTPAIPGMHPPHAVIQGEITFDTVVPFESPQNHTVVQAGIWQPYREVTKPFEMSDFYKYSTKFRQARQSPGAQREYLPPVPPPNRPNDPSTGPRCSPSTSVGVYQPLRPMTCQPVESRNSTSYFDAPETPSVSSAKIV